MDWIKISTDMFRDEKILLLGSDELIAIWIRLLLLAGKLENDGVFMLKEGTPYSIAQLATIMGKSTSKIKSAITAFENLGMVSIIDGVVTIPNWCKHQGTSESREQFKKANRDRQARFRERQRSVITGVNNGVRNGVRNGGITHTDKDLDIDKDLRKKNNKKNNVTKRPNDGYQHHEYTDADFEDLYFDVQAAAEETEKKGTENHERGDTGIHAG